VATPPAEGQLPHAAATGLAKEQTQMDIGFIGLGAMGSAMARNLARAGHRVTAWNRSGGAVEGVTFAGTAAAAFAGDVVVTMLSEDAAIREVILEPGLLGRAGSGLVHVVASTISVGFAHELVAAHQAAGVGYVAAPVLGRPDVAEKGELNILAAGAAGDLAKVQPVLAAIGRKVWHLGDAPPTANAAKVACNMMLTMAIEAMAEAAVLTEANGLGREAFFDVILNTLFGGRAYETYSKQIVAQRYEPGFKAVLGLKDLRLASEAAEAAGRRLPMLDAVRGQMAKAVEAGHGARDWSIMAEMVLKQ
jgi:3-hydroxyisobutyrate dehydrogenase-like beta-hydroxyacid dehydrogenase